MAKGVHHIVKRPGRKHQDATVEIPVADDLATVPGIPMIPLDVAFYSREYPLESQGIEKAADREWAWTQYRDEITEYRTGHEKRIKPLTDASMVSGDLEPTGTPVPGEDLTDDIRRLAREMGFGEVGFTGYDRHYTFASYKRWARYPHAICLAMEQDYYQTQSLPSLEAEEAHYGTYEIQQDLCLKLGNYIRSRGYHAQIHGAGEQTSVFIPMFVAAGLGQLGANGQLLSPHFGSRARLIIITTDAPVTYNEAEDYGIHNFCKECQVCVNRCPGRALMRDKVWYRGAEKHKLIYDRCRPVMVKYDGCAVCIKACPIQRYGMKPVMEHYIETGEVLGKGTENLEGYTLEEKGHFGPGQLPKFDQDFFEFPTGRREDWLFKKFKERLDAQGVPEGQELVAFATDVKNALDEGNIYREE